MPINILYFNIKKNAKTRFYFTLLQFSLFYKTIIYTKIVNRDYDCIGCLLLQTACKLTYSYTKNYNNIIKVLKCRKHWHKEKIKNNFDKSKIIEKKIETTFERRNKILMLDQHWESFLFFI